MVNLYKNIFLFILSFLLFTNINNVLSIHMTKLHSAICGMHAWDGVVNNQAYLSLITSIDSFVRTTTPDEPMIESVSLCAYKGAQVSTVFSGDEFEISICTKEQYLLKVDEIIDSDCKLAKNSFDDLSSPKTWNGVYFGTYEGIKVVGMKLEYAQMIGAPSIKDWIHYIPQTCVGFSLYSFETLRLSLSDNVKEFIFGESSKKGSLLQIDSLKKKVKRKKKPKKSKKNGKKPKENGKKKGGSTPDLTPTTPFQKEIDDNKQYIANVIRDQLKQDFQAIKGGNHLLTDLKRLRENIQTCHLRDALDDSFSLQDIVGEAIGAGLSILTAGVLSNTKLNDVQKVVVENIKTFVTFVVSQAYKSHSLSSDGRIDDHLKYLIMLDIIERVETMCRSEGGLNADAEGFKRCLEKHKPKLPAQTQKFNLKFTKCSCKEGDNAGNNYFYVFKNVAKQFESLDNDTDSKNKVTPGFYFYESTRTELTKLCSEGSFAPAPMEGNIMNGFGVAVYDYEYIGPNKYLGHANIKDVTVVNKIDIQLEDKGTLKCDVVITDSSVLHGKPTSLISMDNTLYKKKNTKRTSKKKKTTSSKTQKSNKNKKKSSKKGKKSPKSNKKSKHKKLTVKVKKSKTHMKKVLCGITCIGFGVRKAAGCKKLPKLKAKTTKKTKKQTKKEQKSGKFIEIRNKISKKKAKKKKTSKKKKKTTKKKKKKSNSKSDKSKKRKGKTRKLKLKSNFKKLKKKTQNLIIKLIKLRQLVIKHKKTFEKQCHNVLKQYNGKSPGKSKVLLSKNNKKKKKKSNDKKKKKSTSDKKKKKSSDKKKKKSTSDKKKTRRKKKRK